MVNEGDFLKILVVEVADDKVHGLTCFGKITVFWDGNTPEIGTAYDVELDIESVLVWGKDVILVNDESFAIDYDGELALLHGILESIDDDGYAVMRMGDYIIPFLSQGEFFDVGSRIIIYIDSISAAPVSY